MDRLNNGLFGPVQASLQAMQRLLDPAAPLFVAEGYDTDAVLLDDDALLGGDPASHQPAQPASRVADQIWCRFAAMGDEIRRNLNTALETLAAPVIDALSPAAQPRPPARPAPLENNRGQISAGK